MNRKIHVACVAAGAFVMSIVGATAAYQYQSFDENPAYDGWGFSSGTVTNTGDPAIGLGKSLTIPILQSVTNTITSGPNGKVSTDFYTIPTLYSSDGNAYPAIDTSATVQFFVDAASSNWVVYSGNGSGGYITNQTTVLAGNVPYPKVVDHTNFHRVTVASDYSKSNFSFFVNDICLATNLNFISAASSSEWFQVQNLGGTAGNVCYLDEYWLTNRVAASEAAPAPIPGGDMSQIDAVYYFETPAPLPVATNATITGTQVAWKFRVEGAGESIVLGGGTTNTITTSKGVLNASGQFTGDIVGSKYFYKIIRRSADSSVTITNEEVYAAYKQTRAGSRNYIVGVPVIPLGGNTLEGPVGLQLAKGLDVGSKLVIFTNVYELSSSATAPWSTITGKDPRDMVLAPGMGVLIQANTNSSGENSSGYSVMAGLLETNTVNIPLVSNKWNILAWPYEASGVLSNSLNNLVNSGADTTPLGFTNVDFAYIQPVGTNNPIQARWVNGTWRMSFNTTLGDDIGGMQLRAGDGIMYHAAGGSTAEWKPTVP